MKLPARVYLLQHFPLLPQLFDVIVFVILFFLLDDALVSLLVAFLFHFRFGRFVLRRSRR